MKKLYRHPLSGHSHRVELFLGLVGQEVELVEIDLLKGEHKSEEFLELNPFGQVPVLDDEGTVVSDSNAILVYLAKRYAPDWLPEAPLQAAQVQRWLSVAAGELAHGPAAARLVTVFGAKLDHEALKAKSAQYLKRLEGHLLQRRFLVGEGPTVADVALYTYTAHAPEGGVDLEPFPNVRNWLARVEALSGFVGMKKSQRELVRK